MVGFGESRKMGEQATSGVSSNYKNTVKGSMKCLIGLAYDDPAAQKEFAVNPGLTFVPIPHAGANTKDTIGVKVNSAGVDSVVPIEAIAGMMIQHMAQVAAETQKSPLPSDYVICIPVSYSDAQRRALITACEMVGINTGILRLLHETTAVALAFGIFKDLKKEFVEGQPQHVLFIDMGATAFTCCVTTFEPGKLTVKSAYYDNDAGGRDFDWIIAEWLSAKFEAKYKGKLSGKPMENPKSVLKLLTAAEKAKKTLSPNGVKEVRIQLEMLLDELDFSVTLSAAEYESMCAPLLARLRHPVEAALKEAGLTPADLSSCEIVGGSSRIGCVKRELSQILGGDVALSTTMNADEAVARGAALQSAILSPRFKVLPYDIQEAQPYPVLISWGSDDAAAATADADAEPASEGVEVDESGAEAPTDSVVMFDRGLSFPIVRRVTLRRSGTFAVKAKYDDAALTYGYPATKAREIADFAIETGKKGDDENKVRVNVKQDIHGIIHLSSAQMMEEIEEGAEAPAAAAADGAAEADAPKSTASLPVAGDDDKKAALPPKKIKKTNLEFKVTRPVDWTRDEVNKVYEAEVAMAQTDRIVQETADKRNELESYIYDMRDKVSSDSQYGPYGTDAEKADFASRNEAMENWLYEDGFDATKAVYVDQLAELKKYGDPLKKRRLEFESRPAATSSLKASLEVYNKWVNESQADEKYEHITDEERATVHTQCDEVSAWLYSMLDKQGGMAANQDPVLTVALLNSKQKELVDKCKPIMTKKAPKKKKEEPKKEEAPAAAAAETPAADPPVSDTEPMEGVEKEKEKESEEVPKMEE